MVVLYSVLTGTYVDCGIANIIFISSSCRQGTNKCAISTCILISDLENFGIHPNVLAECKILDSDPTSNENDAKQASNSITGSESSAPLPPHTELASS